MTTAVVRYNMLFSLNNFYFSTAVNIYGRVATDNFEYLYIIYKIVPKFRRVSLYTNIYIYFYLYKSMIINRNEKSKKKKKTSVDHAI